MAQSGFTPILLYASGTPGNSPSAGNLTSSASGAELAVNYADGKLFYKDSGGNVQTLASKATGSIGGSDTQVQYNSSGSLAGSANLTFNGTTLTANALTVSTGNLTFSGTAQRITGDMSNATLANRLAFQTSTTNGNTTLNVIPNGTGTASQFVAHMGSDPANTSRAGINVSGSAALVFSDITGTGTYLPMTFYTGGSERVRIDTSGNVGIGASPSYTLDVNVASATFRVRDASGGNDFGVKSIAGPVSLAGSRANTAIGFMTNDTERMRIDTSGNVGIGLNNAGTYGKFGSGGTGYQAAFVQSTDASGAIAILAANSSSEVRIGSASNHPVAFYTNAGERMRIDSSGNVGIGTSSPSSYGKFAVQGSSSTRVFYADSLAQPVARYDDNSYISNGLTIRNTGLSGSNQGIGVLFQLGSGGTAVDSGAIQMRSEQDFSSAANQDAAMTFYTVLNGTSAERFRITSTGAITSVDLADAVGYKGTPINEQSAAYGLQLTDQGKTIVHPITDNNARTFTIPANGSIAFPVGTTITFINMINTLTIAITTDTMYLAGAGTTGSRTLAAYGMATAVKITSTSWIISGNGLT